MSLAGYQREAHEACKLTMDLSRDIRDGQSTTTNNNGDNGRCERWEGCSRAATMRVLGSQLNGVGWPPEGSERGVQVNNGLGVGWPPEGSTRGVSVNNGLGTGHQVWRCM